MTKMNLLGLYKASFKKVWHKKGCFYKDLSFLGSFVSEVLPNCPYGYVKCAVTGEKDAEKL
jgi:hypothetical protein